MHRLNKIEICIENKFTWFVKRVHNLFSWMPTKSDSNQMKKIDVLICNKLKLQTSFGFYIDLKYMPKA